MVAVRTKLLSPACFLNPSNSMGLKFRVIQLLPNPQEFNSIAVSQPVLNDIVGPLRVPIAGHVMSTFDQNSERYWTAPAKAFDYKQIG